jgi:hypothetical protein
LVPNSATGDQEGFYFLTFHNDPICSGGNQLYDPVSDPLSTGLSSNPISVDRSQALCCTIGYGSSVGVLAASQRYLSFRQFASGNCSGTYQDYIRIPLSNPSPASSAAPAPPACLPAPFFPRGALLYYTVTIVRTAVAALNYPLPLYSQESLDYDPLSGKMWLGSRYYQEAYVFDPASSAQAARPPSAGGIGYPALNSVPLHMIGFTGTFVNELNPLHFFGLGSFGTRNVMCF